MSVEFPLDQIVGHDYLPGYGHQDSVHVFEIVGLVVKFQPYIRNRIYRMPIEEFRSYYTHDDAHCILCTCTELD